MSVIIPLAGLALVAFSIWERQSRQRAVMDFNMRLLERVSSLKDFGDFVQTEQGAKMLDSLRAERPSMGPLDRVLHATFIGVVATVVGVGLLMLASYFDADAAAFAGGIALALGLGFLIASAVSYRLARTLGVLETPDRGRPRRPNAE